MIPITKPASQVNHATILSPAGTNQNESVVRLLRLSARSGDQLDNLLHRTAKHVCILQRSLQLRHAACSNRVLVG